MIRCTLCGDEGYMPSLDYGEDGDFECNAPGCGLTFDSDEFNADDLSFGFHIEVISDIEVPDEDDDAELSAQAIRFLEMGL